MKRCKLVNERSVVWLRNPLRVEGRVYCNPSLAELVRLEYYPLVDSPRGAPRPGFVQVACYRLEDDRIVRSWKYEEEEDEV